jgi:hypothetical protein
MPGLFTLHLLNAEKDILPYRQDLLPLIVHGILLVNYSLSSIHIELESP